MGNRTELVRREQYRDRWSSFGASGGIEQLSEQLRPDELKRYSIFRDLKDSLLESIAADVSVAEWKAGAVLFEEGSYLDLAFFVVEGEIELFLAKQAGPGGPKFDAERTSYGLPEPDVEDSADRSVFFSQVEKQGGSTPTLLANLDLDIPHGEGVRLGADEFFGEIGAMSGWPQSVTARTASPCTLIQIRLPALRTLRRRAKGLKQQLDDTYRKRALAAQLTATPLFRGATRRVLDDLIGSVELVSLDPDEVVCREGEAADAVYLVRSGFVKIAQQVGPSPMSVNYLSKGMTFGDAEFLIDGVDSWIATATSIQYAELVRIDAETVQRAIDSDPGLRDRLWENAKARISETGRGRRDAATSELLDASLDTGLVQATSMLVIDLETCTRCDDCVRGCAATHNGRPRFVREGERLGKLLITKSCFHCRDPLCLVGCPTGAIRRAGVGDTVAIDEALCIGCSKCETSCPYDVIVMQDTGELWPDDAEPQILRGKPQAVASKCDLCHTREQGPACVHNCPNDCAVRVGSMDEVRALLEDR